MADNWADNVKKYVPDADDTVIAAIVRYCGIALRNRDSSLVSMSDPTETGRVRENFLKKKLGLTHTDEELDAGIQAVGQRMKGENFKNRVTVYYLLLDHFDQFAKFGGVAKGAAGAVAGAAVAGAGALGLASLGGGEAANDAEAAADDAADTGKGAVAAAGAAVAGTAAAAVDTAKDAAASAGDAVKDTAAAAVDTAKDAAGAVTGAAAAAAAGVAGAAVAAGGLAKDAAGAAAGAVGDAAGAVTGAAGAALSGITGAASSAMQPLVGGGGGSDHTYVDGDGEGGGSKWLIWLLLLALLAFLAWWLLAGPHGCSQRPADSAAGAAPATEAAASAAAPALPAALASAPAEGQVTIPSGAGVTTEMRDGKPVVKVYFATGKTDVVPDFAPAAAALKDYLAANAGSSLQVSGYNDPTGNAALNAELSKKRAQAVKADLVKAGIADETVALVKPENTTDATVDKAAARRVEVTVK